MTKVIAHRGSKGTHPENTLAAFAEAIVVGADGIELDVHLTKDRQLVVIHDETVARTSNGHGEVEKLTLAALQAFDAGSWFAPEFAGERIPSLQEVLDLLVAKEFRGLLNIEVKTDVKDYRGIEEILVRQMQQSRWSFDYLYSSFNFKTLERLHALDPHPDKAYIMGQSAKKIKRGLNSPLIASIHPKIDWVLSQGPEMRLVQKGVRPWTVNESRLMQACFFLELEGIHTDFPAEALRYRRLLKGI